MHRDPRAAALAEQLPGQLAPEGGDLLAIVFDQLLTGRQGDAVEDRDAGLRQVCDTGLIEDRRDAGQRLGADLPGGQVLDPEHGVGLTATEGGL